MAYEQFIHFFFKSAYYV